MPRPAAAAGRKNLCTAGTFACVNAADSDILEHMFEWDWAVLA
jgi:hypothetical protein